MTELRTAAGRYRAVVTAAIACAAGLAVYVAWTSLELGGATTTIAVKDVIETGAGFFAAAACADTASRSTGRLRAGWWLLAASAASWTLGSVVWFIYEAGTGTAIAFPSWADVGQTFAVVLVIGALLVLPFGPNRTLNRWRAVLDGLVLVGALLFVVWTLGFGSVWANSSSSVVARRIAVAYPAGDIVVLTILVLAIRKAPSSLRASIRLLAAAFGAILLADTYFAYLLLRDSYGAMGSISDACWVAGYSLFGLAALWPVSSTQTGQEEGQVSMWDLALPWLGVVAALAALVALTLRGESLDPISTGIGTVTAIFFATSQALLILDSVRLINLSRRAELRARESTALLDEVIAKAPLGIARITQDLRFIDANPHLSEMLGVPAPRLVGTSLGDLMSSDDRAQAYARIEKLRSNAVETLEVDGELVLRDGKAIWGHRTISAVRDLAGRLRYFLVMFEDTTAKHLSEEATKANLAESERLNRLKSEFMSMVSHEFRSALTGIQGYSEIMNTQEVTAVEVKEFSGDIHNEALRLNRMITEMLDLDRIESGRIAMNFSAVDLDQIIRDAAGRAQTTTTRHRIVLRLEPGLPPIEGDADRLTQVVTNLLSNAIKYSPGGGEVLVTTQRSDGSVEVAVMDHGQGIPPEFKEKIFGRYQRYEEAGKQAMGTGLGLAISRQIVLLHGGRIWVESTLGQGSVFRFAIPFRQPAANVMAPPAADPRPTVSASG